ncbi:conserved hypothetical protein [Bradyrhizobium sp. ORS 285]|uniref:hypothetical protein n=1 Tax=Bradyrhizobium sp. ORS 285 TaxID=115808 RepID=UPI0002405632|nr:hypothetical protein [Bradyrhizobium sp. ORS 285]CCD85366.1 conserved hypothetical protein [Bradyrhizobium sp. ORS 285]
MPSDRTTPRPAGSAIDPARAAILRAANINPRTGLATDYLNHFNEAVMLLEMIPDIPECAEDFLAWSPLTYPEHFTHTNFKARDLVIEAYEQADPAIRDRFDHLTKTMTDILLAVGSAMRDAKQDSTKAKLAEQAASWVKPLVSQAGGIINGDIEFDPEPVAEVDEVDAVDAIMASF